LLEFFGILPTDTSESRKKKVRDRIKKIDRKLSNWLPVIGEVLGIKFAETKLTKFLEAKIRKQRFFDIVFDFLKYMSKRRHLCVIIEDLHWIDSVSMELLNYIGRNIGDKKILLLLIFRPIEEKIEFMEKKFYTQVNLKELTKAETIQLASNLLSIKELPEGIKRLIMGRSQGNPFYTEEIVKSLIEQGFVYEDEKGRWKFSGDIKAIRLPDTVEGVILSRIDRLDIQEREVLQIASVLGREFSSFLIRGIYPNTKILKKSLDSLQGLDLIKIERERGEIKYLFKHILTQEVAYGTLSFARKREVHQTTGGFIEDNLKDRKDEFLGLLSHHFYFADDYEKALLYSVEAGEKAKKVYANEEAIEFFTRAIESYEKLEKAVK
jgi:adenylate cyclase